jgi:two-component system, sensor histidine kinase and response regulator
MPTPLFHKYIGDHTVDLRHRLLNAFCFMQMWCFLLFTFFDFITYVISYPHYWLLDLMFFGVTGGLYYLSFYKKQFTPILYTSLGLTYLAILMAWYNMGGLGMMIGVAFVVLICYYTFMLSQKWYWHFLAFNTIFVLILALIQLYLPDFIPKKTNLQDEIIQETLTILAMCFVLFIGIYIIQASRDYERKAAAMYRTKLEHLNKVQSQMISIISHDIRSPILNVQLMLNMMENGLLPKEKIPEMARQIGNNMSNSRELLESMVSWTRSQVREINEGKATEQHHTLAHKIIEKSMLEWAATAKRKQINLRYDCGCPEDTTIAAEENLLNTALRNIVLNAIKFTPAEGIITIKSHTDSTHFHLSITDSGLGMSPVRLAELFQNKLNANKGTSGERGSGIGLWIVNDMLQRSHASISATSEEGKGSTFSLQFPLSQV